MKTILKNAGWLALGEGVSRTLVFFLIVAMTRILGPEEYGKFAFAFAFVSLLAMLSNFGLTGIATRELAQGSQREREFSSILSLKILLSAGTLLVMFLLALLVTPDIAVRKLIWILSLFALIDNFFWILYAFLRARERMEYEAVTRIVGAVLLLLVGFFVLFNLPSVTNISYAYVATSLVTLIGLAAFFHFRIYPLAFALDMLLLKKFWEFSWPLGLAGVFGTVYIYSDSIIMRYLKQVTAVGWYGAAYQVIGLPIIVVTLISTSFYPALSRFAKESKENLQNLWNRHMQWMIFLALPLMAGTIVLAPKIINFLYGQRYEPSVIALQILIFAAGLNFLYNPYGTALVVTGQQKKHLLGTAVAALVNIILNIILIPRFSLYGAGIATLISYMFLLALEVEFVRRFTSLAIWDARLTRVFLVAGFASLAMAFFISQPMFAALHVLALVGVGVVSYFALLFVSIKLRVLHV